jgi:erythromycin esterase
MGNILLTLFCLVLNTIIFGQNTLQKPIYITFDNDFIINENKTLTSLFDNKKLIAVGEATHGSKEFIYIRQALFKYLNANNKTNIVLLEAPQSVTFWLNDYINNKISFEQVDSIFKKATSFYCNEFFNFLNECKELNKKSKIYIGGFDPDQYYYFAITRVKHILKKYKGSYDAPFAVLSSLNVFNDFELREIANYDKEIVKTNIDSLSKYLLSLNTRLDKDDFFEIEQCLKQLNNTYTYWTQSNISRVNFRDKLMAETIEFISSSFPLQNIFIWAHNNHVRNNDNFLRTPFGEVLKQKFGDKYLSIGTVFKEGSYRVWVKGELSVRKLEAENCGILADYFGSLGKDYTLIRQQDIPEKLRNRKIYIHDVGILQTIDHKKGNKHSLIPAKDFDMYIYIKKITNYDLY